jgi:ribosomal protein S18 acetylase RimI-like enzyme
MPSGSGGRASAFADKRGRDPARAGAFGPLRLDAWTVGGQKIGRGPTSRHGRVIVVSPPYELELGGGLRLRSAIPADADAIAALHADSWSRHYRGAYSDDYLDGDAHEDRRSVWRARLRVASEDQITIVAEREDGLAGFAHTCCDADPEWGALLDNLHVRYDRKRQGMGRALMGETAATLVERHPASPLYLWVLQQNTAAQAFYAALGGAVVDQELARPIAGGGTARVYRVAWRDPRVLLRSVA